jgi:hypothetical protein
VTSSLVDKVEKEYHLGRGRTPLQVGGLYCQTAALQAFLCTQWAFTYCISALIREWIQSDPCFFEGVQEMILSTTWLSGWLFADQNSMED